MSGIALASQVSVRKARRKKRRDGTRDGDALVVHRARRGERSTRREEFEARSRERSKYLPLLVVDDQTELRRLLNYEGNTAVRGDEEDRLNVSEFVNFGICPASPDSLISVLRDFASDRSCSLTCIFQVIPELFQRS